MNEWKEIKTLADVPEPVTWDQYEWQYQRNDNSQWKNYIPESIRVIKSGLIESWGKNPLRYRPKPLPSDDWIKARVWECGIEGIWHLVIAIEGNQVFMDNDMVLSREWFKTGRYRAMHDPQTGLWE